jgi:hypothetical protein
VPPQKRKPTTDVGSPAKPRLLCIGFHTPLTQAALEQSLRRASASGERPFVALVSREPFLGERAAVFVQDSPRVRGCQSLGDASWPCPPRSIWERLMAAEAQALPMFDRVARSARGDGSVEARKRAWHQLVTFAYGFLHQHRITRVVQCNVPHFPLQFAFHETARAMGIETRFFWQLPVKNTFVLAESIDSLYADLRSALIPPSRDAEPALEPRMEIELERRTQAISPFYMHAKGLPLASRFYRAQKRTLQWKPQALRSGLAYRKARRRSQGFEVGGAPFVYFPLHLQPEATTSPLGGIYSDQIIALEALDRALPSGWCVAVKENPKQRLYKRPACFYERLAALLRVRLVSRKSCSFDLMRAARAVGTITGTAGWEALVAGKPVLTFGNAFYRHAPGSAPIEDFEGLREALAAIDAGRFSHATLGACRRFLEVLQSVSFQGVVDAAYLRDAQLTESEAIELLVRAFDEALGFESGGPAARAGVAGTGAALEHPPALAARDPATPELGRLGALPAQ